MKNKLFLLYSLFFIIAAFFILNSCEKDALEDEPIQVAGVEFAPNFFLIDGEIVGIDADIAAIAMQNAGIEYNVSMSDSWPDAYDAALNGPSKALLTTAYIPERKDLFKWAGPTSQSMYGIFDNGDSGLEYPLPIEDCKLLPAIAVVKYWMETTTLEDLGFDNLVYYDTYNEALEAFMNGEIQFIASDLFHLIAETSPSYVYFNTQVVTRYRTVYNFIAFSKDVSDVVVDNIQNAIETLIKDESTVSIMRDYIPLMPSDYMPGTIQLFSERSPPFSYVTGQEPDRKVEGFSVDIVNEIQERTGHVNKINMSLWNDAYAVVQYLPNSALFRTARTPERENFFQWVGPISTSRAYFYTLTASGLTIETLEQAKDLESIATPNGWFTHDFLIENNFQNIVATSQTSMEAFNQLIDGEVQALFLTVLDLIWLADNNDVPMSDLTQHIEVLSHGDYIAFSLNTPTGTIEQWQNYLNNMKADGTFENIWNEWFEGVPVP